MAEEKKEADEFFKSRKTYFNLALVGALIIVLVVAYRKLKNEKKI